MPTTIQLNEETHNILKHLKNNTNASSYNEVIDKLLKGAFREKSMYGYLGKEKSMKNILKGLRDEHDRF